MSLWGTKILLILVSLIVLSTCPIAFSQNNNTTPQAPKNEPNPLERLQLGNEVPHPIEEYTFKITGTWNETVYYTGQVPYWSFGNGRYESGEVAIGSPFVPKKVRKVGGRHFYGFIKKEKQGDKEIDKVYWVDGNFIEVVSAPSPKRK